jgi:hypothetical protein
MLIFHFQSILINHVIWIVLISSKGLENLIQYLFLIFADRFSLRYYIMTWWIPFRDEQPYSHLRKSGNWFFIFSPFWWTMWSELCQYRWSDNITWSNISWGYFQRGFLCDIRLWIDKSRFDPVRTRLVHEIPAI